MRKGNHLHIFLVDQFGREHNIILWRKYEFYESEVLNREPANKLLDISIHTLSMDEYFMLKKDKNTNVIQVPEKKIDISGFIGLYLADYYKKNRP